MIMFQTLYQNESFNGAIHQLNQEPQVYLPPPPKPVGDFSPPPPPPNNMFRGRGNWRHYHQAPFSHERDDRPYRRRRSHLDDIYLPNYEDNDDLNESDDTNNYHHERFDNRRGNSGWNVRHRNSHVSYKQNNRKRCLTSTKPQATTSKGCVGDKNKTNDECKDSAPKKPCVVAQTVEQGLASISKCDKKDSPTDVSDKVKDSKTEQCSSFSKEKSKGEIVVNKENISKAIKQMEQAVAKTSEIGQRVTDARGGTSCDTVHIKHDAEVTSVKNTANLETNNNLEAHSADVEKTNSNDSEQNKTDNRSFTHKTNIKSVDSDTHMENVFAGPFLVVDDITESPKLAEGCPSKTTPLSDERTVEEQKRIVCHSTLPLQFPTWKQSPVVTKYENPYMSVREIESDEETICYDSYITLDSIDTTKSYLGMDNFGPEFDDYRVTDMSMSTPSPTKRRNNEECEDVATKKKRYDRLYADINSDQLLNEINKVLKEDERKNESTTSRCVRRYRSKSLSSMQLKVGVVLPRCKSLQSIDQSHHQVTDNFDARTNLLVLLGDQKSSVSEISDVIDLKASNIPQIFVSKEADKQKENTNDVIVEKLNESGSQIFKEIVKEDTRKAEEKKIESVSNEGEGKSKESETRNEKVKLVQDTTASIKSTTASKDGECHKSQISNLRIEKSDQREHKSISNDQVSNENVLKKDANVSTAKSHSTDSTKIARGSSDKTKKIIDDQGKESRSNDEAKNCPESGKSLQNDNQLASTCEPKKTGSLVRYSDYKKTVDLSKKVAPPEMHLCAMIGSPKKLTSRRMAFSNENQLRHQRLYELFGSDGEDDETRKCGKGTNDDSDKSGGKKRKCEKDDGSHKRELQPKKLFTKPIDQCVNKPKSLGIARRQSLSGTSTSEGGRESPKYGSSNAQSSASVEKSKQPNDSRSNFTISQISKIIDKSKRRTSISATPSGNNKNLNEKNRIPMPLSSKPQASSSSQKIYKPEDDRKKDNNSKHVRTDSSPRHELRANSVTAETSKDEKTRLNNDTGKSRSYKIEDSKKDGRQSKNHTNPTVVAENTAKKCDKILDKDDKRGKSLKVTDKNKPSTPNVTSKTLVDVQKDRNQTPAILQKQPTKADSGIPPTNSTVNKDLHGNVMVKVLEAVQTDKKQNLVVAQKQNVVVQIQPNPSVQKQPNHSKTDNSNNPSILQPQLVLSRIDDQLTSTADAKKKELLINEVTESVTSEPNYVTCTTLPKDRFPMMQKVRSSVTENECCDRAAMLENPEVTDKMETVKQLVTPSKSGSKEGKEFSDDVIEIKQEIPVIDLTDDIGDVKEEKLESPPTTDAAVKPDNKKEIENSPVDYSKATTGEERITLYRSDETLNNTLEVQAMVASISPNALRNNVGNKKCDDNQPNDKLVDDKTTSASQAVSATPRASPVSIPEETSLNNSKSLSELLIEKAISEAISHRERQISNSNIAANKPPSNSQGISSSGTYAPSTSVLQSILCKSTPTTSNISSNKDVMTRPPNSTQRHQTFPSPRRIADVVSAPITAAQSSRREISSPHHIPRRADNNADTQNVVAPPQLSKSPQPRYPTMQVSFNTTIQSPRRTENSPTEQNFVTATLAQTSPQANSDTGQVILNVLVGNRSAADATNNQTLYTAAPGSTRIENNAQVGFNLAGIEHNSGAQNANLAQNLNNVFAVPAANSKANCNVAPGVVVRGTSGEQGNVNEQGRNPGQNDNNAVDGPLRGLLQLANGVEPTVENENREMGTVGLILIRYLYFFDGLKKAQLAYSEQLKKMNRCLPTLVRVEQIQFDDSNSTKFYKLSADLMRDLRQINLTLMNSLVNPGLKMQLIMTSVFKSIKVEVPALTMSWVYLMLEALMKPEEEKYLETSFLAALFRHVTVTGNHIRSLTEQRPGAAQNNSIPQDLFTPEQRKQLERQIVQYKAIRNNQVILWGNTMQSNLLRAHQTNQIMRAQLQHRQNTIINQQNNVPGTSGASVPVQLYDVPGPPNVSLHGNNIPRNPAAFQQGNPSLSSAQYPEALKNVLQSSSSTKKPSKRTSRANSTAQASKQLCIGVPSGSNLTVPSDITLNPTMTAPIPTPRTIARTPRRNSSPSTLQFKQIPSKKGADGTNESFKIRLPFTVPYDITSSPSRITTVVQHSACSTAQNGTNPSIPAVMHNSGASPFMPHITSTAIPPGFYTNSGASPYRRSTVQNSGVTPSMPSTVQISGVTLSRSSMVPNPRATLPMASPVQNHGATPSMSSTDATLSISSMVQYPRATLPMTSPVQNYGATPSMSSTDATLSISSMVQNSCATPPMASAVLNSGATPPMASPVQNYNASPSMSSRVPNSGTCLSMPLLDEDVPSVSIPNLSHIESVTKTPVYAPMPVRYTIPPSPPPPVEVSEDSSSNKEVSLAPLTVEDDDNVVYIQEEDIAHVQEEEEEAPSESTPSIVVEGLQAVKDEEKKHLPNEDIETIDLTWLEDVDPEQLQNEIEFIEVKKEEMLEQEFIEEDNCVQDPIGMALSPTDSGISSPNVQVEYNEQVFSDRTCICGKGADYVCGCRMAMYCSEACQLQDWKSHKEVCLKHNAKSTRDPNQN